MNRLRVAALIVLAGLLAACTGVPTSGPIQEGPVVDSAESTQFIRVIAAPPSAGAEPEEIVRGFLEANASLEQDHAIARRYLTAEASRAWAAKASTAVYDPATLRLSPRRDSVRARFTVVAELAADGSLDVLQQPDQREVSYTLEQVTEGDATVPQWRIADPANGILISTTDLRRAYRLHETFFMAQLADLLVPDGRLLPVVGASLPTTLAEAVLAGPSAWLAPGVRGTLPSGTALALGAVPVTDGVASVELTEEVLSATDQQRRDLGAALTWTLTELPDISGVQLLVNGEPFDVPGRPTVMDRSMWQSQAPDARATGASGQQRLPHYILEGASIVRVSDVSRTTAPVTADEPETLTGLAIAPDQKRAAAIEPDGTALWLLPLDRASTTLQLTGGGITSASFDAEGRIWFTDDGTIRRVVGGDQTVEVPVVTEGIGAVTSIALGRDGTLVALVAGGLVWVGVLQQQGSELVVGSVERVDWTITDVVDVAWRDASTLDLLAGPTLETRQVMRESIGSGEVTGLGAPTDPTEVAAAPGALTLVSGDDDGIYANVGLQWRRQDAGRSVAYP